METMPNSCNCATPSSSYGPVISNYGSAAIDPYHQGTVIGGGQVIGGGVINGMPVDGQIINEQVIGGGVYGGDIYGGQIIDGGSWFPRGTSSTYSANKYDADGHKILSEEPLPPGAVPAN